MLFFLYERIKANSISIGDIINFTSLKNKLMTDVENLIHQLDKSQKEILLFFHHLLTNDYMLIDKITFKNPGYYKNSWICYLKPLKNGHVELAFFRGNELSNIQGLLKSNGRKQLRSVEISELNEALLKTIKQIVNEAILLDETVPYESKRKQKNKET